MPYVGNGTILEVRISVGSRDVYIRKLQAPADVVLLCDYLYIMCMCSIRIQSLCLGGFGMEKVLQSKHHSEPLF